MRIGLSLGLTQPSKVAGPPPPQKTEAEFNAHIASLASDGAIGWDVELSLSNTAGTTLKHTTVAAAFVNVMGGSPAGARFAAANSPGSWNRVNRIVQHALPEGDLSGATSGRMLYLEIVRPDANTVALASKTVNGYASTAVGAGLVRSAVATRVIWWDGAKAMWRDPSVDGAPAEYTWP